MVEDLAHMRLDDSQKLLTVGRRVLVEDDGVGRVARLRFVDESGMCPHSLPSYISFRSLAPFTHVCLSVCLCAT